MSEEPIKQHRDGFLAALVGIMLIVAVATLLVAIVAAFGGPPYDDAAKHAANQEHDWWWWWPAPDAWTAVFTGVLTISTIGLWWQTKRLAEGADSQAEDTRTALSISKLAADAAQKSAEAAIGSERAWVILFIDEDNLEDAVLQRCEPQSWPALAEAEPIIPEVKFHLENMGKTPAFIREIYSRIEIGARGETPVLEYDPIAPWWPQEVVLHAQGRLPTLHDDEGNIQFQRCSLLAEFDGAAAEGFYDAAESKNVFWFYGHIIYGDVWGNARTTRFCFCNEVHACWFIPPEVAEYNQRT